MNRLLAYACAFLLLTTLVLGVFTYRFFKSNIEKDNTIQTLTQTLDEKDEEIKRREDGIRAERILVLQNQLVKKEIQDKYDELLECYNNKECNKKTEFVYVEPACDIPDPNFRMLKQAYCQNRIQDNFCSANTSR
jgi:hypothetical protein